LHETIARHSRQIIARDPHFIIDGKNREKMNLQINIRTKSQSDSLSTCYKTNLRLALTDVNI